MTLTNLTADQDDTIREALSILLESGWLNEDRQKALENVVISGDYKPRRTKPDWYIR